MLGLAETRVCSSPFLRWAGGKRWLVEHSAEIFNLEFDRLVEPFLGGGAVFFATQPSSAYLSDLNSELIFTYIEIRDNWEEVLKFLKIHNRSHTKDYYYKIRNSNPRKMASRAAKFIYLNRTCFNGLYRVNKEGKFNVPLGSKTEVILPNDNFKKLSLALQTATLKVQDFSDTLSQVKYGDLVFVDPPYTIKHNLNGFLKYNESIFSWADQIRLRDCLIEAANAGAKIIMTNADHECIRSLYAGCGSFEVLCRPSLISGRAEGRGLYSELIVRIN